MKYTIVFIFILIVLLLIVGAIILELIELMLGIGLSAACLIALLAVYFWWKIRVEK